MTFDKVDRHFVGHENENENENESLNLKNENDFFNHLECQEEINKNKNKNKSKFKHLSMNRLSSMSKRRSDPFLFPNIKLLNQPIVTP